jgi:CRP-like cAMP-binding protein
MNQVQNVIQQMISITDEELNSFLGKSFVKTFPKNHIISKDDSIPNEIYFINKGIIRVFLSDNQGEEHSIYFALENQFIAEYYFIYQDNRIKNLYLTTPIERYNSIKNIFPNIHNRVPQHMIASYLGITPIHLSRIKKSSSSKI